MYLLIFTHQVWKGKHLQKGILIVKVGTKYATNSQKIAIFGIYNIRNRQRYKWITHLKAPFHFAIHVRSGPTSEG